ncbi:MAG: hypothetical protein ACI4WG_06985 [Erysipelotrichaceae bacterium]
MKKLLTYLSILVSCCVLSGCNVNSTNNNQITETISEVQTTTTTTTAETTTITTTPQTTTTPTISETTETTVETLVDPNRKTIVRDVCWEDSKEIIKYVETDELIEEDDDMLVYSTEISGISAALAYQFDDEYGLYQVNYLLNEATSNSSTLAISYYKKIKEAVSQKYGSPIQDEKKPLSSLYEYCDSDSQALELGYIGYITKWTVDDTDISLVLGRINYNISFGLTFSDSNYVPPTDTSGL